MSFINRFLETIKFYLLIISLNMSLTHMQPLRDLANKERDKYKKKKGLFRKIVWLAFRVGLLLAVLGVLSLLVLFAWFSKDLPNPNRLMERQIAQSTKIFDNKGETVLYEIYGDEKRTLVKLEQIPDFVKWATISAEDRYFYEHSGFNIFALIKGVFIDPLMGRQVRGGSTITMQLVKNSILGPEKTISRKIKELILSYRIERKFTKDEILQMYLNEIPYGNMAYGIGAAAQTYFGKEVNDLTLAEAAYLAGLPKAPTFYNNNKEEAIGRQQWIIDGMAEEGYITKEAAEAAKTEELHFQEKKQSITAEHFVFYVKEQLVDMFGDKVVEQGGLKVTTTLDLEKQKIAQEAVTAGVDARGKTFGFTNAALLSIEPGTGKILAMVGSKDYWDDTIDGQVNVTTRARQPGSSIKPLIYAAAFKKGFTPDTIVFDVNTKFKTEGKDYEPKNYSLKENGPVTMRKALQGSLNIPAVKTLYFVGVDNALNFLEMMGYSTLTDRSNFGLAIVLGGAEVKMLDHAAAFAVFPNEGVYHQPAAILKVEDSKGKVLYEYEDKKRDVLDSNIAKMMNNILSDNNSRAYIFGVTNSLTLPGRPVAAKTGTTNNFKDAWTVGYTPSLVTAVWVGNSKGEEMGKGADGSVVAAPIWQEYMTKALEGTPVEKFSDFTPQKTDKPILNGKYAIEKILKIDRFSGKIATDYTPPSAVEDRTYKQIHDTLYYVDKDNPQGPAPANPAADPQFNNWESSVQAWVAKKKADCALPDNKIENCADFQYINEAAPTLYDDIHTPENRPTIFIQSPTSNETISNGFLITQISVSAPRVVARVEYYLDGALIQTAYGYPFNLSYQISPAIVSGYHKLRAVAYDDVDNSNAVEIDVNILSTKQNPQVSWLMPASGSSFSLAQFPLTTTVKLSDLLSVTTVNFYYRQKGVGEYIRYSTVTAPQQQNVSVNLPLLPAAGEYELMADIETTAGERYISEISALNVTP
jgi:1A family penicillin-binding protein